MREARAVKVRKIGSREWYDVLDADCPARACFRPGPWTVRGATSSGSRSTGAVRQCCLRREGFGCPDPLPAPAWPAGERRQWKTQ